jgi:putative membrane protein
MTTSTHVDRDTAHRRSLTAASAVHGLQGLLMGTADVIPGVSGGTVALILGIYERLIDSIHDVAAAIASAVRGDRPGAREHWQRADFGLVLPLGVGILVALGLGSVLLPPLIERYPVVTSAVFFGLIAGALPIPWQRIGDRGRRHHALAVAGALVAFVLAGLAPASIDDPSLPMVFGAAAIAICAMILPGVSGAYLLLVMGMYEVTLEAVAALNLAYVGVFAAGAATGLALFSKLLAWLLDARQDATMAVLVGLMAGSLRRLWPWQDDVGVVHAPDSAAAVVLAVACVAIGVVVVTALSHYGRRDHDAGRRTRQAG